MGQAFQIAVPFAPGAHAPAPAVPVGGNETAERHGLVVEFHDVPPLPAPLVQDWTELVEAASEPNSFAEPWFVATSLQAFGAGCDLWIAEVRRGATLIGVMPLAIERHYGRMRVRFIQNWWHDHLFLGTPLVRRGEERAFWSALLARLDGAGWAPSFLHLRHLTEDGPVHRGLIAAAADLGRGCAVVQRRNRALLEGGLDRETYYRSAVRSKKRKELRRLQSRLAELGEVRVRRLESSEAIEPWCDAFLALEAAGWKGREGTALASDGRTERFFRSAVAEARAAGKLEFLRVDLDGRPIAMLVNFHAPPGCFSFKTCFDEAFARFSPGVLIQLENLDLLDRPGFAWADSCALEHHPMIDSLWAGRRSIVRVTLRLGGLRRGLVFAVCRALETASAAVRRLRGKGE